MTVSVTPNKVTKVIGLPSLHARIHALFPVSNALFSVADSLFPFVVLPFHSYNQCMPDANSSPSPNEIPASQSPSGGNASEAKETSAAPAPVTDFHIGDEFGTAKRNLPPARIVTVCVAGVAILVGVIAFVERAKPQGAGSINNVAAAEVPNQSIVLAAITFTLLNSAGKSLWVRTLKAQLTTADGQSYENQAASAVDLDRYYQLFPSLKEGSAPPISPETKLQSGTDTKGTIVVSFPVTKEVFDQRKSLAVVIQPYDQPLPIVLK